MSASQNPAREILEAIRDHGDLGVFHMTVHPPAGIIRVGGEPVAIAREVLRPTTEWIRRLMKRGTVSAPGQYMRVSPEAMELLRTSAKRPAWIERL